MLVAVGVCWGGGRYIGVGWAAWLRMCGAGAGATGVGSAQPAIEAETAEEMKLAGDAALGRK